MAHPLFDLIEKIEKRNRKKRSYRAAEDVQTDPHLARDVGLPFKPRPKVRVDLW